MSIIANTFLSLAKTFAETSNSNLDIVIKENEIKYKFTSKETDNSRISENHYKNAELYVEDSANPVKLDWDNKKWKKYNTVEVFEDFITTKYFESYMNQEAITNIFDISEAKEDTMVKLMYANLAGIVVLGVLLMALYAA